MDSKQIFAQRFRKLRKHKVASMQEVADALCVKQQSIDAYEQGKAFPTVSNLIKLADYFDVSIDYLVGRTEMFEINFPRR